MKQDYFDLSGGDYLTISIFLFFVLIILFATYKEDKEWKEEISKKAEKRKHVPRNEISELPVNLGRRDQKECFYIADDPTLIKGETIIHLN